MRDEGVNMRKTNLAIKKLMFLLWFLAACSNAINESPTETPTHFPENATATPRPIPSSTHTLTSTIIPSPQPTLSKEQAQEVIGKLLLENESCNSPCFWGFSPGMTVENGRISNFFSLLHEKPRKLEKNGNVQYIASVGYKEYIKISATFTVDEKQSSLVNIY